MSLSLVWTLAHLARPFLDWRYSDIDDFANLLPEIERIQNFMAAEPAMDPEINRFDSASIDNALTELTTRLGRLNVPAILIPYTGELSHTLAVLAGYTKERDLKRARNHFSGNRPSAADSC